MNPTVPPFKALLKKNFFAGLLVLLPLVVIGWIASRVFVTLWGLRNLLPDHWLPENIFQDPAISGLVNIVFIVCAVVLLAAGVSFLGWTSKLYLGRKILGLIAEVIQHIPVLRGVYTSLVQLLNALTLGGTNQFSRVVYVEYPRRESWTLAFVTSSARIPQIQSALLGLYVPTTPNPTSGFYILVPEKDVIDADMGVDEALKTIISLGLAVTPELAGKIP